jgi:dTDP-4-amino-4,6-dideoxygalactose transaminase
MKTPRPFEKQINVTKPFLPPLDEFIIGLQEIWENQWLTNSGPLLKRYENLLSNFLRTPQVCLFTNGTLALQLGLLAMGIKGEVITTPFTFAATTHVLYWNNIKPVFVDIEPDYYTIDPDAVEAAITPETTAILGVHVYGHPCRLQSLADIARRHDLTLIYDAAHAFGVTVKGESICHFGDMSMFSFHATKLYHSVEGGMLTFHNKKYKNTLNYLKNFGIKNEVEVIMPGTNAKMTELQALMGMLILRHIDDLIQHANRIDAIYRDYLKNVPGIKFPPHLPDDITYNYSYQPVEIIEEEFGASRDSLYEALKKYNIYTRRNFYPLICDYSCYREIPVADPLIISRIVSNRILTLPNYYDLSIEDVIRICETIQYISRKSR